MCEKEATEINFDLFSKPSLDTKLFEVVTPTFVS